MMIPLHDWLRTGLPAPLQWGDTRKELLALWPNAQAELDAQAAAGSEYLTLGGVEFYFNTDPFGDLWEVCIKAWTLAKGEQSPYFEYGWLHRDLTNAQVQATLQTQGVAYAVERGPGFQTPNLRTGAGVLFAFYADFDTEADAELSKVYLGRPTPGMWSGR